MSGEQVHNVTRRKLAGLRRQVSNALQRFYRAQPGESGTGWKCGRLLHENEYRGKKLTEMSAAECSDALDSLRVEV